MNVASCESPSCCNWAGVYRRCPATASIARLIRLWLSVFEVFGAPVEKFGIGNKGGALAELGRRPDCKRKKLTLSSSASCSAWVVNVAAKSGTGLASSASWSR